MNATKVDTTAPPVFAIRALEETLAGKLALCVAASALVAVFAHVSVPLPFTPVPLTLSNFAVLLVGLTLAPSTAFWAMLLYLIEGAVGLPVFTPGGAVGLTHLLGPTGGFLIAYPFAAALTSALSRTVKQHTLAAIRALAACSLATLLILVSGAAWFGTLLHLTFPVTLKLAVLPFLPGELIKIASACGIFLSVRRLLSQRRAS